MSSLKGMRQNPVAMSILKLVVGAWKEIHKRMSLEEINLTLGMPRAELEELLTDLVSVNLLEMKLSGKLDIDQLVC